MAILIWKFLLFLIYLGSFAELKGWRFFGAMIVMGILILVFAAIEGYLGIKTPIL